jgi:hypothetical protein
LSKDFALAAPGGHRCESTLRPHAPSSRRAKRASRLGFLAGRWLAEQGELILVWDRRAEHPQHPIQLLLLFVAILGSDRLPQAP